MDIRKSLSRNGLDTPTQDPFSEIPMPFSMQRELPAQLDDDALARRSVLAVILEHNGMLLRDDSQLAYHYIVHGGDVQLVAHEILCANFLFQNTRYDEHCQQYLKVLANMVQETYKLPWKKTWEIVREYGVPAMKVYAMAESGKHMPDFDVRLPADSVA